MTNLSFEQDFPRHPLHYFVLLCIQLIGVWGIFWFGRNSVMQFSIALSMAISYVIWGIIHHQEHHDLHPKIIFEYLVIALLAVLIFASVIFRA